MKKLTFIGSLAALLLIVNMLFSEFYQSAIISLLPQSYLLSDFIMEVLIFLPPLIIIFIILIPKGINIKKTFRLNDMGALNIILISIISIFIQPVLMLVSAVSSMFFHNQAADYLDSIVNMPSLSLLLVTALIPAFFEEMYFRGLIFSNFKNMPVKKACFLCGLLFGMAHLNFNQFSYAFLMGMVFCYFVYITDSIFSSMLCHFLINGLQTILAVMSSKFMAYESMTEAAENTVLTFSDLIPVLYLTALSLMPLAFFMFLFHKHNIRRLKLTGSDKINTETALEKTEGIFSLPLIITVIIFAAVALMQM